LPRTPSRYFESRRRCNDAAADALGPARRQNEPTAAGRTASIIHPKGPNMLKWALIFLVVSIVAGFFGFSGLSAASAGIAKILFFICIVVFLVFLVLALMAGRAIT